MRMNIIKIILFIGIYLIFYRISLLLLEKKWTFICNITESLIGLLSAGVFAYLLYAPRNGESYFQLFNYCAILFGMSIITIADIRKRIVPNIILFGLLIAWIGNFLSGFLFGLKNMWEILAGSILGMVLTGLLFFICYLFSKGNLGEGDVKLAMIIGLYLTFNYAILIIFIASICCFLFSVIMIVLKKIEKKDTIAFVPFLYLGILIVLFFK